MDLDQALVDLAEIGSVAESKSVGKALATVGARSLTASGAPLGIDGPDDVALT